MDYALINFPHPEELTTEFGKYFFLAELPTDRRFPSPTIWVWAYDLDTGGKAGGFYAPLDQIAVMELHRTEQSAIDRMMADPTEYLRQRLQEDDAWETLIEGELLRQRREQLLKTLVAVVALVFIAFILFLVFIR